MKLLKLSAFLMCCVSMASADEIKIQKLYQFYIPDMVQQDTACLAQVSGHLASQFRGLKSIALANAWISQTSQGALAIYSGAVFRGDYGDATGAIHCLFGKNEKKVTDIGVAFQGSGLGGFEKRGLSSPSKDPADWKTSGISHSIR